MLKYVFEVEGSSLKEYILSSQDIENILRLRNEKYITWEWNYGNAPEFDLTRSHRFEGGEVQVHLNVQNGIITAIRFFGDFMSLRDISDVEEKLKGQRFKQEDIKNTLLEVELKEYFGSISLEEILTLF